MHVCRIRRLCRDMIPECFHLYMTEQLSCMRHIHLPVAGPLGVLVVPLGVLVVPLGVLVVHVCVCVCACLCVCVYVCVCDLLQSSGVQLVRPLHALLHVERPR